MPSGLIRYEDTGSFHFLTFTCYHRHQYLGAAEACDLFEDALERVRGLVAKPEEWAWSSFPHYAGGVQARHWRVGSQVTLSRSQSAGHGEAKANPFTMLRKDQPKCSPLQSPAL